MRKTKVDASKKRQIGLPASILDDSDEGSFSSSSSSGSLSDFQSSPEDSGQEDRDHSDSGATSSDDSRSVTRRKRSFLGDGDSTSSYSPGEDEGSDDEDDLSQPKRMVQPIKRSRLQRQDESDSDHAEEKRREKAKRRQRHNKLLALSRRMKGRVPNRRRRRVKQVPPQN